MDLGGAIELEALTQALLMKQPRPRRVLHAPGARGASRDGRADERPHEIVTAPELAPPVGYAHAVVAAPGRTVYLGGQTALDAGRARSSGETLAEQFDVAAGNVVAALRAAGVHGRGHRLAADLRHRRRRVPGLAATSSGRSGGGTSAARYPAAGLFGVTRLFDEEAKIELMAVAVPARSR